MTHHRSTLNTCCAIQAEETRQPGSIHPFTDRWRDVTCADCLWEHGEVAEADAPRVWQRMGEQLKQYVARSQAHASPSPTKRPYTGSDAWLA